MNPEELRILTRLRNRWAQEGPRAMRQRHRLSTVEVARALGVNRYTVWCWEARGQQPTPEYAVRYAKLLDALEAAA